MTPPTSFQKNLRPGSQAFAALLALAGAAILSQPAATRAADQDSWKLSTTLTARESYDSNVFLQDTSPDAAIIGALPARRASLVSSVAVSLAGEARPFPALTVAAIYAAEAARFHSAASEDSVVHRLSLNTAGRSGVTNWSWQNSGTWIDGSDESPIFGGPGGAASMAGIPLRDRRDAFVGRSSFKLTHTAGPWLLRPVAAAYLHDFHTRQRRRSGYVNYIDRQELLAGVDLGRAISPTSWFIVGMRAGRQEQLKLHGEDSAYDHRLQRLVAGIEGKLLPFLQVNLLAGPEFRRTSAGTAAGFDRERTRLWLDASAALTLGPRDVLTIAARRFEQPAFASCSVYEDITYELAWRRKISDRLATTAGFKAYGGDWPAPFVREDWIFTSSASAQYAVSRRLVLEFACACERADSRVPATAGREYRRHLASAGLRFTF